MEKKPRSFFPTRDRGWRNKFRDSSSAYYDHFLFPGVLSLKSHKDVNFIRKHLDFPEYKFPEVYLTQITSTKEKTIDCQIELLRYELLEPINKNEIFCVFFTINSKMVGPYEVPGNVISIRGKSPYRMIKPASK